MKTPFTVEQFFEVFRNYNQSVFPIQILFYIIAAFLIYLILKPSHKSDKIINIILAFFWLWMGVVYHIIFFTVINKAAYIFGTGFILQSILFLVLGAIQKKLSYKFRSDKFGITGIVLIIFAMIIYPILGYFFGHIYPVSPTFGLPCPTTIFTLGILLQCTKKCPVIILIIPVIWSVIEFTAAFQFGIFEDAGLLISGLLTVVMLLLRNRTLSEKNIS